MRESTRSFRIYLIVIGSLSLIGSIARLMRSGGDSLPVGILGVLLALAWLAVGIALKTMLVQHLRLVLALFGVSVARGLWLLGTGVFEGDVTAIFAGAAVAAIALYLCFNAARLSRELRAAQRAGVVGPSGAPGLQRS